MEVRVFQSLVEANSNIIEVGSNIGLHSVPLAKFIPQGKLFCFEPQRIIFQQLCCNLALNNLINVYPYQLGVSDNNGRIEIQSTNYDTVWNYGNFSINDGFSNEFDFQGEISIEQVDIISLDNFAPIQQLEQLALLKIDAEGVDVQVLKGASKTIERLQPVIFIEVNIAYPESNEAIIAYLHKLNYQLYWLASHRQQ